MKILKKGIYSFDITLENKLTNKTFIIDWSSQNSSPDGLIMDNYGNLSVGEWNGNTIYNYNSNGKIIQSIQLPFYNPTKMVFGGKNFDTLDITSGRF